MARPGLLGESADLVPDSLLLVCRDGAVLDFNRAASRMVPRIRAGASLYDLVADPPDEVHRTLGRWARSGGPVMGALTFSGRDGPVRCRCRGARATWVAGDPCGSGPAEAVVAVHASPRPGMGVSALLKDRSGALSRELSYRQRTAIERERRLLAERGARDRMQRLYQLSTMLAGTSTLREVAQVVQREAAEALGGITAVLSLFPDPVLASLGEPRRRPGAQPEGWHELDPDASGLLSPVAWCDRPTLITAPARPLGPYSVVAAGYDHAAHCVPLRVAERRVGVLAVALPPVPTAALLEQEHVLSVGAQVAQAVARARLFEHEHRLAERLQRSLLPRLPRVPQLTVASRYLPNTESVRVGGDWYDLFELAPGQVGMAIGDVAGHSLAEATVMAQLQNALRAIALEHQAPGAALGRLNEFTHAFLPEEMATACYLTLDLRSGRLRFASAGHLPPLLIPAAAEPRLLWGNNGPALGAAPAACYPEADVPLATGDTLLLYTDGLVEQRGKSLDEGLDRLLATARQAPGLAPRALCDLLTADGAGAQWQDDRALLAVRVGRPARAGGRPAAFAGKPAAAVGTEPAGPRDPAQYQGMRS